MTRRQMWTSVVAVMVIGAMGCGAQGTAPKPQEVRQAFASPAKIYRPLVRWWWPGNDVTPEELKREVGALDAAGFGGAEIQPFAIGVPKLPADATKRLHDYPTPDFFRNVGVAVKAAKEHGMFIDYTFGSGWPFGGAEITPELASVELRWSHVSVQGPEKMHTRLELPGLYDGDPERAATLTKGLPDGWTERLEKRVKLVAVVAVRGEDALWYQNQVAATEQPVLKTGVLDKGSPIDLTAKMQPDGTLDWDVPPGTWQIFVYRSAPTVHKIVGGVGEGPQLEMDHWNSAAFAAHAKAVGDNAVPYLGEYFGNGLRAIFCDSLEVKQHFYWSDDFIEQFKKRRGYDVTPYLPILKVQGYGGPFANFENLPAYDMPGVGDQVRRDYWQTVSDLMIERFFDPFNAWAHEHKLLARTQSHGAPADVLKIYGDADIPETEDLYDNGRYDFLKEAAASAHVYGRSVVGSESFVWRMGVYQTTPEKMKRAGDELLTAGINAILYHGFAYQLPGQGDPGWHPFAGAPGRSSYSSQFNEENPFWPYFAKFNAYLTRVQYISQVGKSVSQVAVYRYELQHGAKEPPPAPAPPLQQGLMDAGYNYDAINEESLLKSKVEQRELVTAGGAHYSVLAMPSAKAISVELAEKLAKFAAEGLPVVFVGEMPSEENGWLHNAELTRRVAVAVHGMSMKPTVHRVSDAAAAVVAVKRATAPDVHFEGAAFPYFERRIGGLTAYFLRNAGDAPQHVVAEFRAAGKPELWDPWTGKVAAITAYHRRGSVAEVSFDMTAVGSAMIVFTPEAAATTDKVGPALKLAEELPVGESGWSLKATGLVASGKTATLTRSMKRLENWVFDDELKGFSGRGLYATTFALPDIKAGERMVLNLGEVGDVADVTVNGKAAGTLLCKPYTLDVTALVHAGENTLEVTVTNALYNSMILRTPRKFGAGATMTPSGLLPAGLIGPVEMDVMK